MKRTHHRTSLIGKPSAGLAALPFMLLAFSGCPGANDSNDPYNPFQDLPPIEYSGRPIDLESEIVPLGLLEEGQVLQIRVTGDYVQAVLILAEDDEFEEAGRLAGGGPPDTSFLYRARIPAKYYLYVLFQRGVSEFFREATAAVELGDETYSPPAAQPVRVHFDDDFIRGLHDPIDGTTDELDFLDSISDEVRRQVIERLESIFAGTPIEILDAEDPVSGEDESTLRFRRDTRLADDEDVLDVFLPDPDDLHPECESPRVVFGRIVNSEGVSDMDVGNQNHADAAEVFVGSFQGEGATCRTAVINSISTIVLGLSHTAAHEIGHLVGLFHVPLTDIMERSPTLAFQRELSFRRGQVLLDYQLPRSNEIETTVLTTVYQDPDFYFQAAFGRP